VLVPSLARSSGRARVSAGRSRSSKVLLMKLPERKRFKRHFVVGAMRRTVSDMEDYVNLTARLPSMPKAGTIYNDGLPMSATTGCH
jgi:hypothetical protein